VERAAATGTGGEVMETLEPVEMSLPSHPHVLSRRDLGAPQTSNHDPCATRPKAAVSHRWALECGSLLPLCASSLLEGVPEASFRQRKAAASCRTP